MQEEKVTIEIDDEDVDFGLPNTIQEEIVDLFTGGTNGATATTGNINGFLEGIIIATSKPIQILITLAEAREIVLYDNVDFKGTQYLPLRTPAKDEGEGADLRFNFAPEKWALNNQLKIELKGATNTETKVIVRYS
jgi:hypothetical protein